MNASGRCGCCGPAAGAMRSFFSGLCVVMKACFGSNVTSCECGLAAPRATTAGALCSGADMTTGRRCAVASLSGAASPIASLSSSLSEP